MAYSYLFNIGANGTGSTYLIPQSTTQGEGGLMEFEQVYTDFASAGSWVYESITTNSGNITGISVPITGDYQIDFTVNGINASVTEDPVIDFGIGSNGTVTVSGTQGTTSSVSGIQTADGLTFMNGIVSPQTVLLTGSLIANFIDSDVMHLYNTQEGYDILLNSPNSPISMPPNLGSIRISLLRPT